MAKNDQPNEADLLVDEVGILEIYRGLPLELKALLHQRVKNNGGFLMNPEQAKPTEPKNEHERELLNDLRSMDDLRRVATAFMFRAMASYMLGRRSVLQGGVTKSDDVTTFQSVGFMPPTQGNA